MLLREGLVRLLQDAGMEVVGQAGDADDLLRKTRAHKPDVVIVDVRMPPTNTDDGLRAAQVIRRELPEVAVLVLSQYIEQTYALELLEVDAKGVGYLLKDRVADVERFIDSIKRVADGGSALDPEVVSQLLGRAREDDPLADLTPREREVLELMAEGRTNQAIADSPRGQRTCRREARHQPLRQARPHDEPERPPAGPRRAHLPEGLKVRQETGAEAARPVIMYPWGAWGRLQRRRSGAMGSTSSGTWRRHT